MGFHLSFRSAKKAAAKLPMPTQSRWAMVFASPPNATIDRIFAQLAADDESALDECVSLMEPIREAWSAITPANNGEVVRAAMEVRA